MQKKPVKDVFCFWQIKGADFAGKYEIPIVHGTSKIPGSLVRFTDCQKECNPENKAVHFYQFDENFEPCLSSEAKLTKKLEILRKYQSVILPDFSVYKDMPLAQQIFQVYKSRAVGNFLMRNSIPIIPNIRWGDERTYEFAFEGIEKWGTVATGVQGAYKNQENDSYFKDGFYQMLEALEPETILCYGHLPETLKAECTRRNIVFKIYPTEISKRNWEKSIFHKEFDF